MKCCEPALFEMLKGLVSNRVYEGRAPQNAVVPYIVYQKVDGERWHHLKGPSGVAQDFMQVDTYGADAIERRLIRGQVESILDGYIGTVYHGNNSPQEFVKIGGISHQSDFNTIEQTDEPFLYRNCATYLVTYDQ